MSDEAARQRAIELLDAHHHFPEEFSLSVIAGGDEAITAAILKVAAEGLPAPLQPSAHQMVPSAGGKYVSHRLRIYCRSAAEAFELLARLRAVEGVITVM